MVFMHQMSSFSTKKKKKKKKKSVYPIKQRKGHHFSDIASDPIAKSQPPMYML